MDLIRLDGVGLVKKGQTILADVSLEIGENEMVGIAGPSGSGKSSLLRMINLLQSPTEGRIFYKGKDIMVYDPVQLRRIIGYVPQKPFLFEGTVRDNLEYAYAVRNLRPNKIEMISFLEKVNLKPDCLDKQRDEISGGEQQRAAFVRSLLVRPEVLLLDEITAALDEENTIILENFILEQCQAGSVTVVFVTHNAEQLRRMARKVVYVEQGKVVFKGSAQEYFILKERQK